MAMDDTLVLVDKENQLPVDKEVTLSASSLLDRIKGHQKLFADDAAVAPAPAVPVPEPDSVARAANEDRLRRMRRTSRTVAGAAAKADSVFGFDDHAGARAEKEVEFAAAMESSRKAHREEVERHSAARHALEVSMEEMRKSTAQVVDSAASSAVSSAVAAERHRFAYESAEREATAQLKAMKSRAERAEEELRAFERRVEETEVRARARTRGRATTRAPPRHAPSRPRARRARRHAARPPPSARAAQPPARALAARARAPAARDAGDAHAAHPP